MHICRDQRTTVAVSKFTQSLPELLEQRKVLNFDGKFLDIFVSSYFI
jgi:hypothetical protein